MRFVEENRKLCYGLAAVVVILLVLWPSFREGRPAVVSFFKPEYNRLETSDRQNGEQIVTYYNQANPRMMGEIARGRECNAELGAQFTAVRDYIMFIPAMPFKVPADEVQPGLKFLEIQTKAHSVELVRYARLRDVEIEDMFFGMNKNGVPPETEKLPLLMRQLAMIDDLARKAIDSGVRQIGRVTPMDPVESGPLNKTPFLKLYPVCMAVSGPFDAIIAFVNSLDGFHGKVTSAITKTRTEGEQVVADTVVEINLGSKQGLRDDHDLQFTIFDDVPDKADGLRYKGRAKVTQLSEEKCVAVVRGDELKRVHDEKEIESRKIKEGDIASGGFYTLLDLKIEAVKPSGDTSLVNRITAVITVAGAGLLEDSQGNVASVASVAGQAQGAKANKIRAGGF